MNKIFTIGEALIDFIPVEKAREIKDVNTFIKMPGGAPANVAVAVAKLGGQAGFIGKLGQDGFGDFLVDILNNNQVDTTYIKRTEEANTALAFVVLAEDGERDFSFYRNPSADMLLNEEDVADISFQKGDILHFGSVDLIEAPVKYAHIRVIEKAMEDEALISFDPNVRLPLWSSSAQCKKTIIDFLPYADVIKVSEEELEFLTGEKCEAQGLIELAQLCKESALILLTKGAQGVTAYDKQKTVKLDSFNVEVIDTTGAGDSFIGAFLYQIAMNSYNIKELKLEMLKDIIMFASGVGALTTTKSGAISALPDYHEVALFIKKNV